MRIDATSVSQSAPGRSVRPTEPRKSTSPENRLPSAWYARCAGEWPGTERTSKAIPAASIVSPPSSSTSGVCGRTVTPAGVKRPTCSRSSRSPSAMYTGAPVPRESAVTARSGESPLVRAPEEAVEEVAEGDEDHEKEQRLEDLLRERH